MRLPSLLLGAALALAIAPAAHAAPASDESQDFKFPGADTIALQDGSGRYITYGASTDGRKVPFAIHGSGAEVGTSPDVLGDAMPDPGGWVKPGGGIWTPGAWYWVKNGVGRYYLFFTATPRKQAQRKCVGVASSTSPTGPFKAQPQPLACPTRGTRWALDADVTQGPEGAIWMTWRDGQRATGPESALSTMIIRFADDGTVSGVTEPKVIMRSNRLAWAHYKDGGVTVLENPSAFYDNGQWYLFYSGNSWQKSYYATGIAACGDKLDDGLCQPIGGTRKAYFAYTGPKPTYPASMRIAGLPGNKRGPGAMDVYRASDGRPWVTWNYLSDVGGRKSRTGPLTITGSGLNASFAVG